ncbi:MAG TPA: hypothetical protein VLD59_13170 [Steroidobacteraceae bacterium]|nr:hypothetical protein [Steroidobacteraceae bacterium]
MPEEFFCPLQPPDAVQAEALVDDHVSCVLPPLFTVVGFALSVAVGVGLLLTVTVTLCMALVPPGPMHCAEKVLFDVMLEIVCVPDVATLPLQSPEPVHEVALVDDQVSCVLPPIPTDIGSALSDSVGGLVGDSSSVPPEPQPLNISAEVAIAAAAVRNDVKPAPVEELIHVLIPPNSRRLAKISARPSRSTLTQPSDPPPELSSLEPPPPPPPPAVTVTVTLSLAEPPAPVQLSE